MNILATGLLIGFYVGVFSIILVKYLASRDTEQDEKELFPDSFSSFHAFDDSDRVFCAPPTITKKPRKVKRHRVSLKPSMRNGAA